MSFARWSGISARSALLLLGLTGVLVLGSPAFAPSWARAAPATRTRTDGERRRAEVAAVRDEFLRSQVLAQARQGSPQPDGGAAEGPWPSAGCVRAICAEVGPDACSSDLGMLRVARICNGNYSGACVRVACGWLGAAACLDLADVTPIAAACRADFGGACLAEACRSVGPAECGSRSVLLRLIEACRGNFDARCLAAVCSRSASHCGSADEVVLAARACGGSE